MAGLVGLLRIGMTVATGGLSKGLTDARKDVSTFSSSVGSAGAGLGVLAAKAAALAAPFLALHSVISRTTESMGELDRIGKFSDEVGLSVDQLRGLRQAAGLNGASIETLEKGLQRLTRRLGEAKLGMGEGQKGLAQLGLSAETLTQAGTYDALGQIADAIKAQPDAASKAAAAYSLFGRQGQEMLTFLNQGSEGLDAITRSLVETQGSMSRWDISQVEMANDAIQLMSETWHSVYQRIAIEVAPYITIIAKKITSLTADGIKGGTIISDAFGWVASAIGVGADVIDVFHDTFLVMRAGVTKGMAFVVDAFNMLAKSIEYVLNKIPGMSVSFGNTLDIMSEDLHKLAGDQWQEAKDAFAATPPSEGINQFFEDIHKQADAASQALRDNSTAAAEAFAEAQQPALDLIESLQQEIQVLQLGADAAKRFELQQAGVAPELLKQVEALQDQKKALEDSQAAAKAKESEVAKIIDATKSPLDKFREQLDKLNAYKIEGLIDEKQFTLAAEQAAKSLGLIEDKAKNTSTKIGLSGVAEFGSAEARKTILNTRLAGLNSSNPNAKLEKTSTDSLAQLISIATDIKKVANKTSEVVEI